MPCYFIKDDGFNWIKSYLFGYTMLPVETEPVKVGR